MTNVEFCGKLTGYCFHSYKAIGSLSQLIEGARIKSKQNAKLNSDQWLVLFKDAITGVEKARMTIENGKII